MDSLRQISLIEQLDFLEKFERKTERKTKRRKDFFDELDDPDFRRRFRLSKESVAELTILIHDKLEHKSGLNNALTPVEQVLIGLRYYASACMLAIADMFGVSQPTVSRVVHRVSEAIASLLPQYISLPADKDECREVSRKMFDIAGFPGIIGVLNCTFVRIATPSPQDVEKYRCHKNYCALNVQTIIDADLVIRSVEAKWPGSTDDSTIFANSSACLALQTNPEYENYHLLGHSGYSIEKYLLIPLENPRSPAEDKYNESHVKTRNAIERKYRILKKRFPCLSIGLSCDLERVPAIIIACCVLHNLAIRFADPEPLADPQLKAFLRRLELDDNDLPQST